MKGEQAGFMWGTRDPFFWLRSWGRPESKWQLLPTCEWVRHSPRSAPIPLQPCYSLPGSLGGLGLPHAVPHGPEAQAETSSPSPCPSPAVASAPPPGPTGAQIPRSFQCP